MWNVFSLIYFPSVYVFDKVCVKIFGSLFIFSYLSYYCWILSVILNNSLLLDSENCSAIRLFATPWSVCGILQARILEWVAIPFFRGSSWPRSPALKPHSLPSELPGKPFIGYVFCKYFIPVWLVSCSWQCLAGKKKKKLILMISTLSIGEGNWPPTPVFLPEKFHVQRSLVGGL